MNKKTNSKLLAYIVVPVIFTVLGYALLAVALKPVLNLALGTVTMFMTNGEEVYVPKLGNIYDSVTAKPEPVQDPGVEGDGVIKSSDFAYPELYSKYGEISCERIGVSCDVYWGDTDEVLEYGAGNYTGSYLPGYGRMILIAGHNQTYFLPFQYAEVGDIFKFSTYYGDYEYEVKRVEVYDENDLARYVYDNLTAKEELVMYNCYPFHVVVGRKTDRMTLFCDRISGPDVQWIEGQFEG
jgi:sortase A